MSLSFLNLCCSPSPLWFFSSLFSGFFGGWRRLFVFFSWWCFYCFYCCWIATHKALWWDPDGWAVINPVTVFNGLQHTILALRGGQIGLIQSITWSYQALEPICFIPTVLLNLCLEQVTNPYLLGARRQSWEDRNLISAKNLKLAMVRKPTLSLSMLVVYPRLNQGKGKRKNQNQHLHPDIQPTPHCEDRLLCREGQTVCPSSFEVLQMPKVWTPQGSL